MSLTNEVDSVAPLDPSPGSASTAESSTLTISRYTPSAVECASQSILVPTERYWIPVVGIASPLRAIGTSTPIRRFVWKRSFAATPITYGRLLIFFSPLNRDSTICTFNGISGLASAGELFSAGFSGAVPAGGFCCAPPGVAIATAQARTMKAVRIWSLLTVIVYGRRRKAGRSGSPSRAPVSPGRPAARRRASAGAAADSDRRQAFFRDAAAPRQCQQPRHCPRVVLRHDDLRLRDIGLLARPGDWRMPGNRRRPLAYRWRRCRGEPDVHRLPFATDLSRFHVVCSIRHAPSDADGQDARSRGRPSPRPPVAVDPALVDSGTAPFWRNRVRAEPTWPAAAVPRSRQTRVFSAASAVSVASAFRRKLISSRDI